MAGGPIFPHSAYPVTAGSVFPNFHVGSGTSLHDEGLGVADATTLTADAIWRLRFQMPPTSLPSGTCKLRILSLANATTGDLKVNAKWASIAVEESPSAATLNAEGTATITWAAGDAHQYKETKITLDADTPVAGEIIAMDLTFEDTATTLAAVSTHICSVIWE